MLRSIVLSIMLMSCGASSLQISRVYAQAATQNAQTNSSPESVVRDFYAWYTGELNRDNWEPLKNRREALKYLTPEFHKRIPRLTKELMVDVVICAQDWDKSWAKDFTVGRANVSGAKASTVVRLPAGDGLAIKIKVALVKRGDVWRINGTDCVN